MNPLSAHQPRRRTLVLVCTYPGFEIQLEHVAPAKANLEELLGPHQLHQVTRMKGSLRLESQEEALTDLLSKIHASSYFHTVVLTTNCYGQNDAYMEQLGRVVQDQLGPNIPVITGGFHAWYAVVWPQIIKLNLHSEGDGFAVIGHDTHDHDHIFTNVLRGTTQETLAAALDHLMEKKYGPSRYIRKPLTRKPDDHDWVPGRLLYSAEYGTGINRRLVQPVFTEDSQ